MGSEKDAFTNALHCNARWRSQITRDHPDLLPKLATGQSPPILWIGCSDSRCPETTILGLLPGDVFVHRNIANILHPGDLSAASVIEYAVHHLKVQHVVLCGHTSCGGVAGALGNKKLGVVDLWLVPLRELRMKLSKGKDWERLDEKERVQRLVEENVKQGVKVLMGNRDVIEAMESRGLTVHGVVYDIGKGEVRVLECGEDGEEGKKRKEAFLVK